MNRRRAPLPFLASGLAVAVLLSLCVTSGCRDHSGTVTWISAAETAHHDADALAGLHDYEGARRVLEAALSSPVPPGTGQEDARVVRQDLYYQLSTVEVRAGRLREAVEAATKGLALGKGTDVFTSNLLVARGAALEKSGENAGASRDYHDALLISEQLMNRALSGDEQKTP